MSTNLDDLSDQGVSIWLDDLSRERIASGNLVDLVEHSRVVGVTTNPTIFAAAIANGELYDHQIRELAASGVPTEETITQLTTQDVRDACDVLADTYRRTGGVDGRVSIEVAPTLAFDAHGTIAAARTLWAAVDRPNLMVKIPATREGLSAVTSVLGEGISVNVTLIFALRRYAEVMDAYVAGLALARRNGHDLATIHSVASFFVSRVDAEIDAQLDRIGTPTAGSLKGQAALANARLAHLACEERFGRPDFLGLPGANRQRPLWASTGVKSPAYPDTLYVAELVAHGVVNTMPEATLRAFADHGEARGDTITGRYAESRRVLDALAAVGIDYDGVVASLEREGVEKFVASWHELVTTVEGHHVLAAGPRTD